MLPRQNLDALPPKMFLLQIADKLTELYIFLWERQDKNHKLCLNWKDVFTYFNKNMFRSNLRKLNNQGLLSYEENSEKVKIELTSWDEVESDFDEIF